MLPVLFFCGQIFLLQGTYNFPRRGRVAQEEAMWDCLLSIRGCFLYKNYRLHTQ